MGILVDIGCYLPPPLAVAHPRYFGLEDFILVLGLRPVFNFQMLTSSNCQFTEKLSRQTQYILVFLAQDHSLVADEHS
jgi:hypothetical protein